MSVRHEPEAPGARRRRLMIVLTSDVRGGVEEHALSLLRHLPADELALALVCPPALARVMADDLAALPVEVFHAQADTPFRPAEVIRLWRAYRAFRPDVVHCHLFRAALLGAPVAKLAGVPAVVETAHLREEWRRGRLKGGFFLDRIVARFVDRFVAVSDAVKVFLVDGKGYPESRITVIRNGRDLGRYQHLGPEVRAAVRAELGLSAAAPVVGVVARLEPQKGHRYLLEAFVGVRRAHPSARLLVAGDGAQRAELEAQSASLGLAEAVVFAGFRRDVQRVLSAVDVAVLPSLYEGLPLMAIEALAMGVPLVATAVDGTPEVVQHEVTGLLVPPRDPGGLADAIGRLLREPALGVQLGTAGAADMRARFELSRQVEETMDVYRQVMFRRAGAASAVAQAS